MKTEEQIREMLWGNRALLELCREEAARKCETYDAKEEADLKLICGILAIVLEESKTEIPDFPESVKILAKQMRADSEIVNQKKIKRRRADA